jgi:hypothetical protein
MKTRLIWRDARKGSEYLVFKPMGKLEKALTDLAKTMDNEEARVIAQEVVLQAGLGNRGLAELIYLALARGKWNAKPTERTKK